MRVEVGNSSAAFPSCCFELRPRSVVCFVLMIAHAASLQYDELQDERSPLS